ncbi:MAG: LamG domain-containing protein, partial [bacterium]|nr:LamG domain-containing protein [bacterium]
IYTLDQDPAVSDLSDTTGRYQATVHKADVGLPKLVNGARGFSGQAWNFKGVDSSFSSEATGKIQTLGDIENTKGISVSFWMKIPLKDQKNHFRVLGHPAFEATMATAGYGGLGIAFGPGYHVMLSRGAGYTAFDNQWHHIVATADFSTRRDNAVIYLDGEEVARADGAANESFNDRDPRTRVYIGARRNGGHAFTGALDDVSVYDYPLSPEQVLGIYTGPVFAGAPQEVYLPDAAKLKGIAPKGSSLTWSKMSGPGEVTFADASQADTVVRFSVPG